MTTTGHEGRASEQSRPIGRLSRALHLVGAATSGAAMATAVAAIVSAWLVGYLVLGFPTWMANVLQVTAAAVTLVMVFVIQHTQRRVEIATQLKLDELVRTSDADDRVAAIETEDDDELHRQRERRSTAAH